MDFHCEDPKDLEIDQIVDFLHDLKDVKRRNWRTIKIYVAGLRWYYQHMLDDVETASQIPYPKEEKALPKIISREELTRLFDACTNPKTPGHVPFDVFIGLTAMQTDPAYP